MTNQNCAVILAAGEGKRMKSKKPKVLCDVLFKPMLDWVLTAASSAAPRLCVVIGHGGEQIKAHIGDKYETVEQAERLGTGHAVMQAKDFLETCPGGNVLVLCGDAPLMDKDTISQALRYHCDNDNSVTVISARLKSPTGYGRIVRDHAGFLTSIVEERDADADIRAITEVNSGAYWFKTDDLLSILSRLTNNNAQGEYYLTDAVSLMIADGLAAAAYTAESPDVVLGANDRIQLLSLNDCARKAVLRRLMADGVEIVCDDGIVVGPDTEIGPDTCILPGTIITGNCRIGSDCTIGPNTRLINCGVGDHCTLPYSDLRNQEIPDKAVFYPFTENGFEF